MRSALVSRVLQRAIESREDALIVVRSVLRIGGKESMAEKRAQVIVVVNQKGGCGKTTTAINLAAGLAQEGRRTVLVDLDAQCNTTDAFSVDPDDLQDQGRMTVADALLANKPAAQIEVLFDERLNGNLSLIPGHRALGQVETHLEAQLKSRALADGLSPLQQDDLRSEDRLRLKKSLATLAGVRDFIIIDTPPKLEYEMTAALFAADWYLIPVFPGKYNVDGLAQLTANVQKIRQRGNARLRLLGVVLGQFDARTVLHRDIYQKLLAKFPDHLCQTVIGHTVKHEEATFRRETIYEYVPRDPATTQFANLTKELLERLTRWNAQADAPAEAANG